MIFSLQPNAPGGRAVSLLSQERPMLKKTNHRNLPIFVARATQNPQSENEPAPYEFTYMGSDGRLKATFEQAANVGFPTANPGKHDNGIMGQFLLRTLTRPSRLSRVLSF